MIRLSRCKLDQFKGLNKLPFQVGSKRNERTVDSPDYTILKKITEPVLPKLQPIDDKVEYYRKMAEYEANNLLGMDMILGKEFEQILKGVEENQGYLLIIGYLELPFSNQDYAFDFQLNKLAKELEACDSVITHRYAKHVRDNIYDNYSGNPSYSGLKKISWLNTDICFSYNKKTLPKTLATIKKNNLNFIVLGGIFDNVLMDLKNLEKSAKTVKKDFTEEKLQTARAETIGILGGSIQGTSQILGQTINEFGSIIDRIANEEMNKTSRYLDQVGGELTGLLGQLGTEKDE